MKPRLPWLAGCIALWLATPLGWAQQRSAQWLHFEGFEERQARGWRAGGKGDFSFTQYGGNTSVRLTRKKTLTLGLSTLGFERVSVGMQLAASSLEKHDKCYGELSLDDGKSWLEVVSVADGADDGLTLYYGELSPEGIDGNSQILVRFRAAGKDDEDYCWGDNLEVAGARLGDPGPAAVSPVLTADFLHGSQPLGGPVRMQEFALPEDAELAEGDFSGKLKLAGPRKRGGFQVLWDFYGRMAQHAGHIERLPSLELEFVQNGADLIPVKRGVQRAQHPYWEYLVQPGRIWRDPSPAGGVRAAAPFALQERSANCTHNGMLAWAFDGEGRVSRVVYQISSETCPYFKFNMWGAIPARFEPGRRADAPALIDGFLAQRRARLPSKPFAELGVDHPGIDLSKFGAVSGIKPSDLTVYGFVADGIHYLGGCDTRHGPHPRCESIALPSYSTAKSLFAGVAMMRLEKLYPGAAATNIAAVVPACSGGQWADVTIEHAVDMATGNYQRRALMEDERSDAQEAFIFSDSHLQKIDFSCNHYRRKTPPGSRWIYHTSDTYVAGLAMAAVLKDRVGDAADLYRTLLAEPIWQALNLSPLLGRTKRTYDDFAQPFTGYGLTYEPDDVARLARWLLVQKGRLGEEAVLDEALFNAAMQRNPADRGLPAPDGAEAVRYNNGFWGRDVAEFIGCDKPVWVPFLVGAGGIEIVLFPNGVIYYYFSDGYVHRWRLAADEANRFSNFCR